MDFTILLFLELLLLGGIIGFLTGLFGIGGGVFLVPTLLYLFHKEGIPIELATPMASGTSLGVACIASVASIISHRKRASIDYKIGLLLIASGIFGVQFGVAAATTWNPIILHQLFGMIVSLMGIYVLLFQATDTVEQVHNKRFWIKTISIGLGVSFLSGILGIGGGSILIPMLILFLDLPLPKAVGTSTLFMAVAALSGVIGYVYTGWHRSGLPAYTLGYIHLGILFVTGITIFLVSRFGVAAAHKISPKLLVLLLAALLLFIGIRSLFFV